ncbi:hypothetical protein, partial [Pectobacterium aroidearum]|uniref:hypothetical protein n=1 Tax=Pectobacterium aroidearum TaxID=1201031 RepID=UPI003AFA9C53
MQLSIDNHDNQYCPDVCWQVIRSVHLHLSILGSAESISRRHPLQYGYQLASGAGFVLRNKGAVLSLSSSLIRHFLSVIFPLQKLSVTAFWQSSLKLIYQTYISIIFYNLRWKY